MDNCSNRHQYWYLIFLVFSISMSSCQIDSRKDGNMIPPPEVFDSQFELEKNLEYLNDLIQNNKNSNLKFYRAKLLTKYHLFSEALKDIKAIEEDFQDNSEFSILKTRILLNLKDYKQVEKEIDRLKLNGINSLELLNLVIEWKYLLNQKDSVSVYLERMNDFEVNEEFLPHIDQLKLWVQNDTTALRNLLANEKWLDIPTDLQMKIYFDQMLGSNTNKNYIENLELVLGNYPKDKQYFSAAASYYFTNNNFNKTVQYLKEYQKSNSLNDAELYQLAYSEYRLDRFNEAFNNFSKINPTFTEYAMVDFYKGLCLLNGNQATKGYAYLDSIMKIHVYSPVYLEIYRGIVARRMERIFNGNLDSSATN